MLRHITVLIAVSMMVVAVGQADPPFTSVTTDPTAYSYDLTHTEAGGLHTYVFDLTFHGGAVPEPGSTVVRMRAFIVYGMDSSIIVDASAAGQALTWAESENGSHVLWEWATSGNPNPPNGDCMFPDPDPTSNSLFTIVTNAPLPDPSQTAVHILWRDASGEDQSEWVNNTPELPPSLLSLLGFGGAALMHRIRRRRNR